MIERLIRNIAPFACMICAAPGERLCRSCVLSEITLAEQDHGIDVNWGEDRLFVFAEHANLPRQLVHAAKFERQRAVLQILANAMASSPLLPIRDVVVPLPTAGSRQRARGYDQAVLLARAIARQTNTPLLQALQRNHNKRQVGASRKVRIAQAGSAYRLRESAVSRLASCRILLIDDVVTTGASIVAARDLLLRAGAKSVSAATFTRTPIDSPPKP